MRIKAYIANRKLQMIGESQELAKKRDYLQSQLQIVNRQLLKLDIELEILTKLEQEIGGKKEC